MDILGVKHDMDKRCLFIPCDLTQSFRGGRRLYVGDFTKHRNIKVDKVRFTVIIRLNFFLQTTRTSRIWLSVAEFQNEQTTQHQRLLPRICCTDHRPVCDMCLRANFKLEVRCLYIRNFQPGYKIFLQLLVGK